MQMKANFKSFKNGKNTMAIKSPAESFVPNRLYVFSSPSEKVYMSVVEEGLYFDSTGAIRFNPNKPTYLSKLQKRLESEVSKGCVDFAKDDLIEDGILTHDFPVRFHLPDGRKMWTEGIRVNPEFAHGCCQMFKFYHERN
jgi:hypothetical protein